MRQRGVLLLEQVVCIGLLGFVLLLVAAMTVQTARGGRAGRVSFEAHTLVENTLERYQAQSLDLLPLGVLTPVTGELTDGTPYTLTVEVYSLGGGGVAAGLTDDQVKGIRAWLDWRDSNGSHTAKSEGLLVKIAR